MNKREYLKHQECETWVKVEFHSTYSHGTIVMKTSLFEKRLKHLYKVLKDCVFVINYSYIPPKENEQ